MIVLLIIITLSFQDYDKKLLELSLKRSIGTENQITLSVKNVSKSDKFINLYSFNHTKNYLFIDSLISGLLYFKATLLDVRIEKKLYSYSTDSVDDIFPDSLDDIDYVFSKKELKYFDKYARNDKTRRNLEMRCIELDRLRKFERSFYKLKANETLSFTYDINISNISTVKACINFDKTYLEFLGINSLDISLLRKYISGKYESNELSLH